MKRDLDCRGLVGAALDEKVRTVLLRMQKGTLKVTVDSPGAQEIVSTLAIEFHCKAKVEEVDGTYFMWLTRDIVQKKAKRDHHRKHPRSLLVFLSSDSLGEGELGKDLMAQFLETLKETGPLPDRLICANTAVRLAVDGSPVLDTLKELEDMGVDIFSSEKSLRHFDLAGNLRAGSVLNMFDIVSAFAESDAVWHP